MHKIAVPAFLILFSCSTGVAAPAMYRTLRDARPDGRTIAVSDLTLTRDVFTIRFESGRFHLLAPVEGRTVAAVFLGTGRFTLVPATESERRYLAMLGGTPELKAFSDSFDRMVLFFKDDTLDEISEKGRRDDGSPDPKAVSVYESHLKSQRKDWKMNVQLRMYRAILQRGSPFYAFVDGGSLASAFLAVDPVGIFDDEETCLWHHGDPHPIYSSHRREELSANGSVACPRRGKVDAVHYAIDTRIRKKSSIDGVATLRFKTLVPDVRFVPLDLLPQLRIQSASLLAPTGAVPLDFVQEDEDEDADAALIFPEPLPAEQEVSVRIAYSGDEVLHDDGDGNFEVTARTSWYPNLGLWDFATYDLTFHAPPGKQVVSVGRRQSTADEPGGTISEWKADRPIPVAGFNYGVFRVLDATEKNTGVKLQVYTNPGTPDVITEINRYMSDSTASLSPADAVEVAQTEGGYIPGSVSTDPTHVNFDTESLAKQVLADASNSIQVYSAAFGPLPWDHISLTQQSAWDFGQSWPTLVFLPYLGALSAEGRARLGIKENGLVDEVNLHEVAHQWWGHRIGWRSYRDQWISEGFAEFSTALALEATRGRGVYDRFFEKARRRIVEKSTGSSVRNCDAGSVTLGVRLQTMRAPSAYDAIAYSKGAYVLHMLRMLMRDEKSHAPDERFLKLLRDFLQDHEATNVTTEDFKAEVEKHMVPELNATRDGKIDWFFDQWVYGTEIPRYTAKVEIDKADGGKWHVHGTIAQEGVSAGFLAVVPLYLEFDKGRFKSLARAAFKGNMTQPVDVTLDLDERPKRLRLNVQHEVLSMDEP